MVSELKHLDIRLAMFKEKVLLSINNLQLQTTELFQLPILATPCGASS